MATYARDGDPGCDSTNWNQRAPNATGPTSDPKTFRPALLNTTQWFDSITALGAKTAVLTAKHGCGFLLWPTNATLPAPLVVLEEREFHPVRLPLISRRTTEKNIGHDPATSYGYHTDFDLLQDFVDSARESGVGYGFYYSIAKNYFLCRSFQGTNSCTEAVLNGQHNVTDEEYRTIVNTHVTELWTNYGSLAEVWIDSALEGFGELLETLQPMAAGTPNSPRYWCGTESGFPSRDAGPGPIWQTGTGFHGDPSSQHWVDKYCDPQLFRDHIWFYEPHRKVRTLDEMIPIYHDIVGRGMVMELAFAINRKGLVEKSHEVVYNQLGDWVRDCYGTPILSKQNTVREWILKIKLPAHTSNDDDPLLIDRLVLQEDLAVGQRIRNYTIALVHDNVEDGKPDQVIAMLVSNGTSVGRKRIHVSGGPYFYDDRSFLEPLLEGRSKSVKLTITKAIGPPHVAMFGLYKPCYPESSVR